MSISDENLLEQLLQGKDLDAHLVTLLFDRILSGAMPQVQIAASLVLLRAKGETAEEISAAAELILHKARTIAQPNYLFADVVGTGGDGHNTINVSTLSSITASSLGLPIAKHGNASVSSKCGSADLLREWGVATDLSARAARTCLDRHGFCFLLAPSFHPTFKSVKSLRQELKVRTIFNIIGPLVNPLRPPVMLVGVYDPRLLMTFALALKRLSHRRALIVHGAGLDEIALHGVTQAVLVDDQSVSTLTISPSDLGLGHFAIEDIRGGDPKENARIGASILQGNGDAAKTSIVSATTGMLLWLAEMAPDFKSGVARAYQALQDGLPMKTLITLKEFGDGAR